MTLPEQLQAAFAHFQAGRTDAARTACRAIVKRWPKAGDAHHLLGIMAYRAGALPEALRHLQQAVAADPRQAEFHNTLGAVRRASGDLDGAIAAFEQALALMPRHAQAAANLGNAFAQARRHEEAADCYRRALAIQPNAGVHNNLGNVLVELGDIDAAIASFRAALALAPNYPEALSNLGVALTRTERFEEAIEAYRKALSIDPDHLPAIANIGGALLVIGRLQEAMDYYERTLARRGDITHFQFNRMALQNYLDGATGQRTLGFARAYGESLPPADAVAFAQSRDPNRRLRVGFVSADLHEHSVTRFLLPLLEAIDPAVLHVIAFSMDAREDAVTARLRQLIPEWHSLRGLDAAAAADLVRAAEADILIDLSGFTNGSRLDMFARRAAPVQATWLGYSGTTGVPAMDYILADPQVAPPGSEGEFTETIWRLPRTYLCFGRPDWPATTPLPALDKGYVTFGSFNNIGKVGERTLAAWIDLLRAVPESRLLLKSSRGGVEQRLAELRETCVSLGIAAERLRFVDRLPDRDAHLALYGEMDIGLDPFPYNGTTTTCEALWSGVPVLGLSGDSFASRVGASLLTSVGLADWVATDAADYVRRGAALAADLQSLASLRAGLAARAAASPLGDAQGFARDFETALRGMWQRWCATTP